MSAVPIFPSATSAWRHVLREILTAGRPVAPRGLPTLEVTNNTVGFDMHFPVVSVATRKLSRKFLSAEALWILNGDDRVDAIEQYNKNIAKFSDDGRTFFGAYGPRVVSQLPYVVACLQGDPASRQAVLATWIPTPPVTKDVPCTLTWTFFIRRGDDGQDRLHSTVAMRSSDAWLGWPYDVFNFTMVAAVVAARLNQGRPIAEKLGLGTLVWSGVSSHLYEPNFLGARACLEDSGGDVGPTLGDRVVAREDGEVFLRTELAAARDLNRLPDFVWGTR